MAVRCCITDQIIVQKPLDYAKRPVRRSLMVVKSQFSPKNSPLLRIRTSSSSSSIKNKVFEDRAKGIVCYRDENGEITCEGYDEGPRHCQEFSKFSCNSMEDRDTRVIDLLRRCWPKIGTGGEFIPNDGSIFRQQDFN